MSNHINWSLPFEWDEDGNLEWNGYTARMCSSPVMAWTHPSIGYECYRSGRKDIEAQILHHAHLAQPKHDIDLNAPFVRGIAGTNWMPTMKPLSKEARELIEEIRKYGAMLDPSPYATPANEILNHFASLPDVYAVEAFDDKIEYVSTELARCHATADPSDRVIHLNTGDVLEKTK